MPQQEVEVIAEEENGGEFKEQEGKTWIQREMNQMLHK